MSYFENSEITIEITNACSASCVMCPREKQTRKIETMEYDVWKKTVDDALLHKIKVLDLCGYGDVFLDPKLFEKIKYAKKINPDFHIYVSTTGIAMTKKKFEDVAKYIDTLKLSIYGMDKKIYEEVMGGLDYDKAIGNILAFQDYQNNNNSSVYVIANYIVMDENKHQYEDWINFWEPRVDEVYAWKPHNYVDGRKYRDISGQKQKTCGRPLDGPLTIAVNGDAHVCCFDYNKILTVGSIKNQTIKEILDSDETKRIQDKHRNNDFSGLICSMCDQTVKDDSVLLYKTNPDRVVGMSNSSMHVFGDTNSDTKIIPIKKI